MLGNPRLSWILDSKPWIPDSRNWIPVFVSGSWILDSNRWWVPDYVSCIPDSSSKIFPDSEIRIPLHETKNKIKYRSAVLSCSVMKATVS